jgi:sugar/nucleoside kinase (ribokinase family)
MSEKPKYDMVILGNYTKDTIVSPTGTRNVDGGGFNYGAHVAAMMGLKTATVTRLAKEDSHVVSALEKLGLDVFPEYTPHSTNMKLFYPTTNVDERILSVAHTAGSFTPDQVKDLKAKVFIINASIRGEVGMDVIKEIKKKDTELAGDVQGFLRIISSDGTLVNANWGKKKSVLSQFDILKTDAVEAESLTGMSDKYEAAKTIAGWGPKEIVLTHRDGLLVYADDQFFEAGFYPKELIGRSGRGDTCGTSYIAKRFTSSPKEATIWAAAVTSLKMEAEGPIRRTISEVEELIGRKYKL